MLRFSIILFCLINSISCSHRGEHISMNFYLNGESADSAKDNVQKVMNDFVNNFQQSLNETANKLEKFSAYFSSASEVTRKFNDLTFDFFETSKNESLALIRKLRHYAGTKTTTAPRSELNDYFNEMENFQQIFSNAMDDAMDFIEETLRSAETTFESFAQIQREILERRKIKPSDWCRSNYKSFLSTWSSEIFKCVGNKLKIVYDIYAITKINTFHIMRMMEHRVQKIYNCFVFGNYEFRCRFVKSPEGDFEKLIAKIDELQMYNEKQKRKSYRDGKLNADEFSCLPENFPEAQMTDELQSCFYFQEYSSEKV